MRPHATVFGVGIFAAAAGIVTTFPMDAATAVRPGVDWPQFRGIAATGVDAVLRRAQVAPATLYAHFRGKDHLVEEGQLQQAAARDRKAALADEAVAEAKADEATESMSEASREAAEAKGAARARAESERSRVQRQRDSEHALAAKRYYRYWRAIHPKL